MTSTGQPTTAAGLAGLARPRRVLLQREAHAPRLDRQQPPSFQATAQGRLVLWRTAQLVSTLSIVCSTTGWAPSPVGSQETAAALGGHPQLAC
jgi:hypothetical protein